MRHSVINRSKRAADSIQNEHFVGKGSCTGGYLWKLLEKKVINRL
ncbi:hypothetical protein HMPREF3213_01279 [Heyndrickxia coagulans]|uniref:Uncharacterized protein n=1 Tax=Heyndrickxia coagulans TaxID=1398 RepID=A0A133KUP0_HEYCO|nr:hypothetical protein HMPREF3213_01279 [Heyndrickxia coagulans]